MLRKKMRHTILATTLLLLVPAILEAQPDPGRYVILYTGRLLGYPRTPDVQTYGPPPAAPAPNRAAAAYAGLFGDLTPRGGDNAPALRLGMGDNFAPNLPARMFQVRAGTAFPPHSWCQANSGILIPKDRFYYSAAAGHWFCDNDANGPGEDPHGNNTIDYDNVVRFFTDNRYDAVVPGKHDFYFGVERLRSLARLLAQGGVHMIGANLANPDPAASGSHERLPSNSRTLCRSSVARLDGPRLAGSPRYGLSL